MNLLANIFLRIYRYIGLLLAIVLILLAITVSVVRYGVRHIEDYQQEVITFVQQQTGLDFSVERIRGSWHKRTPSLAIDGLEIYSTSGRKFRFGEFFLAVDIVSSLREKKLYLKSVSVKDARFDVVQQSDGKWHVAGIADLLNKKLPAEPSAQQTANQGTKNIASVLTPYLSSLDRIDIQQTDLVFHFIEGGQFSVNDLDIQLEGDSRHRRMTMTSIIDKQHVMKVLAEITGRPGDDGYNVSAYGKLNETEISGFIPVNNKKYQLDNFLVNGEFWLEYNKDIFEIIGQLAIPELRLKNRDVILLGNFKTDFIVDNSGFDDLKAWMRNISWQWSGNQQAFDRLYLEHDFIQQQMRFYIPGIELQSLSGSLLASGLLSEKLQDVIETLNPRGKLQSVYVNLPLDEKQKQAFSVELQLDKLTTDSWKGVPGFENISGKLVSHLDVGGVILKTGQQGAIDLPYIYNKPLQFDSIHGQVNWIINQDDVQVQAESLYMQSADEKANILLGLDLPKNKELGTEPWMTLMIGLENSKADLRNKYIPYTLDESTLEWLDTAIVAGEIARADFIFEGSLDKDTEIKPSVQLKLGINNGELKFLEEWPALTDIRGSYLLDNENSFASVSSAAISGLPLEEIEVFVGPKEGFDSYVVETDGHFNGNVANAFSLLMNSPIHDIVGSGMDDWQIIGSTNGDVNLLIPLDTAEEDKQKIWINANLEESSLRMPSIDVVFNHINGALHFDGDSGLSSYGLAAMLWGEDVDARIVSDDDIIQVFFNSSVKPESLGKWLEEPLFDFAEGKAQVSGKVYLAEKSHVEFDSDLTGISLQLPRPFNKKAADKVPMHIHVPLEDEFVIDFDFSSYGKMKLEFTPDLQRGEYVMGTEFAMTHKKGLVVRGQLDYLQMDDWLPIVESYAEKLEELQLPVPVASQQDNEFPFVIDKVSIKDTEAVGASWGESTVSIFEQLVNDEPAWQVNFDSKDAKGRAVIFEADLPMQLRLDLIRFEAAEENSINADVATFVDPLEGVSAEDIPNADVTILRSFVGEEDYGNWNFAVRTVKDDVQLQNIQASVKGVSVSGSAIWSPERAVSTFVGKATTGDFGNVLEAWEISRSVEARRSEFALDLDWQGSPAAFDTDFVKGDVTMLIEDGHFIEASASASGALKALSLLNFTEILRRVKFDFSDMKKGVNFEKIRGSFYLNNMVVKIKDSIDIKGSAGRFQLSGEVDMQDEIFANELVVTLPVSKNLPWIAMLVGGLNPVGLGAAAVTKLLDKQVDKISSGVYAITGSFDDPQVKFLRVFTDKAKKREVERKVDAEPQDDIAHDVQKEQTRKLEANQQESILLEEE